MRTFAFICLMPFALTLISGSAHATERPAQPATAANIAEARSLPGTGWPASAEARVTTSGDIFMANLDSQIVSLQARQAVAGDERTRARLALAYYHRFQILGRLDDAERARGLLETAEQAGSELSLAAATVLMGFHEFGLVQQALGRAAATGRQPERVAAMQAALDHATGKDWPNAMPAQSGSTDPAVDRVLQAFDRFNRGQAGAAARLLREAQDAYTGTSPHMLAWIQLQQGIQFLRLGDLDSARRFFGAALERFPQYVLAAEHLAEVELLQGDADTAARRYEAAWSQTGNPEFLAQWAEAEAARGNRADADKLAAQADQAWADRVARYPLLAADHGARYYLGTGRQDQALALARANFANRRDIDARILLVETLAGAGLEAEGCGAWREVRAAGFAPPELAAMAAVCLSGDRQIASVEP